MDTLPLWRVIYAVPGDDRIISVVRAATAAAAVEGIEHAENTTGRGLLITGSVHTERVYENADV
jgi:hypothetical protein